MNKPTLFLLLACVLTACNRSVDTFSMKQRQSLEAEILPTFQLAEGLDIELFAAEPLVKDPVAMEIDENGNLFVVEMPGYPLDVERTGRIVQLLDTDNDGFPDKRQLFADELVLPTGIMRWKNGFIVTDAPDVLYLEDTDGDGHADKREVMLTGFALSNPQHNLNTPMYGLDNWIYLAHEYFITTQTYAEKFGDEGSEVHFPAKPDAMRLPSNANDLSVRFQPDKFQAELLSSNTQYGHTFSPWGHYFQTSNANHLYHEVIQAPYLARKPYLLVADAMQYVPDYGRGVEVFAITKNPEHQLLTDVGTITSACGINWYQGGLLPKEYDDVVFTCEPTHNLIHADRLSPKGATFSAARVWPDKEFLASTDAWFRPVQIYTGPDGALYVIDYHRQIIEHPEWMDEEVNENGQLYNGTDKGRIYRIAPKDTAAQAWLQQLKLNSMPADELIPELGNSNIWWRRTAQRLLVDKQAQEELPLLKLMAINTKNPFAQLHTLWTLQGMGALDKISLKMAVFSPEAGLRENAIKLIELNLRKHPDWAEMLYLLANDTNPRVRFQLLGTLGFVETTEARQLADKLLMQDIADEWVHLAALSSPKLNEPQLLATLLSNVTKNPQPGEADFIKMLASATSLNKPEAINQLIQKATIAKSETSWWRTAILSGIAQIVPVLSREAFSETDRKALASNLLQDEAVVRKIRLQLLEQIGNAGIPLPELSPADGQTAEVLADALRLQAVVDANGNRATFQQFLLPSEPAVVQQAAIESLGKTEGLDGCNFILSKWPQLTPDLRETAVGELLRSPERMHLLLDSVQTGWVDPGAISWRRTVQLMNNDDTEVKAHARAVLAHLGGDREQVVQEYLPTLDLQGNLAHGQEVFQTVCGPCHAYQGKDGTDYGPDLASVRNRPAKAILTDILMPNRSIADGYEVWTITQQNGQQYMGIIASETASTLSLRDATGQLSVLPRSSISSIEALPASGMPDGLEQQLSQQDMADVLLFIRRVQ